jgi:hypothetical protein
MQRIPCPSCNRELSAAAHACPACGRPMQAVSPTGRSRVATSGLFKNSNNWTKVAGILGAVEIVGIIVAGVMIIGLVAVGLVAIIAFR